MIVVRGIGIDKNFGAEPVLSQCSISLQKWSRRDQRSRKDDTDENSAWTAKTG